MATLQTANVTTITGNVYASTGNTVITFLSLCNYTAANVNANVYVVPSGDIAGNLNCLIANILIQGNDTYQIYTGNEKLILSIGDSVQVNASANNSISTITSYTSA